jgi:hypothetical protein
MNVPQSRMTKNEVSEWAIVRPITEAARNDGHDLSTGLRVKNSESNKRGVEIHRLNADLAQYESV